MFFICVRRPPTVALHAVIALGERFEGKKTISPLEKWSGAVCKVSQTFDSVVIASPLPRSGHHLSTQPPAEENIRL